MVCLGNSPSDQTNKIIAMTPTLPQDLLDRGFKLIIRDTDRMFATSIEYGCTGTKSNLNAVISEARSIAGFVHWVNRKRAEEAARIRDASNEHDDTDQPAP